MQDEGANGSKPASPTKEHMQHSNYSLLPVKTSDNSQRSNAGAALGGEAATARSENVLRLLLSRNA